MPEAQRKEAYSSDVTYSTNQELGFDYLRDHLTVTKDGARTNASLPPRAVLMGAILTRKPSFGHETLRLVVRTW